MRLVLNRIYRLLVDGREEKSREEFDAELWAPEAGWDAAERQAMARAEQWLTEQSGTT